MKGGWKRFVEVVSSKPTHTVVGLFVEAKGHRERNYSERLKKKLTDKNRTWNYWPLYKDAQELFETQPREF